MVNGEKGQDAESAACSEVPDSSLKKRRLEWPASITYRDRWRRFVWPVVTLLVAGALSLCAPSRHASQPVDDWTRYHDRQFRVARVVDGDTIIIDCPDFKEGKEVTRVRLWGVDSPETAHHGGEEMYFGPQARAFAERTLMDRKVHIVLSPTRTREKYGRLLAYVYLERGGQMFNEMLLEEGYAYADLRFKHHYDQQFKAIEKRAHQAAAGLWANHTVSQMPEWRQRFEHRLTDPGD